MRIQKSLKNCSINLTLTIAAEYIELILLFIHRRTTYNTFNNKIGTFPSGQESYFSDRTRLINYQAKLYNRNFDKILFIEFVSEKETNQ